MADKWKATVLQRKHALNKHGAIDTQIKWDPTIHIKNLQNGIILRPFLDAGQLSDITAILNPDAMISKAYLHLERIDSIDDQNDQLVWSVSIGLSNYIKQRAASKIIIENIQDIRIGTMVYPVPSTRFGFPNYTNNILIEQLKTQAYQNNSGPTYNFIGRLSQFDGYSYRGISRWYDSAKNTILEHNRYFDRHGYSGSWVLNNQLQYLDQIAITLGTNIEKRIPMRQMHGQITATTIGAGGQTITYTTTTSYASVVDPFIAYIRGFRTDNIADDSLCGIINRTEGWNAIFVDVGQLRLSDFITSENYLSPFIVNQVIFQGTPVLTDATVDLEIFNVTIDLELSIKIPDRQISF